MAQIDLENIKKIEKERNYVQDKVPTTYSVFEVNDEKFVQIDTYGREGRKNPEKISQSIQLDKRSARFLVNLLSDEFRLK